MFVKLPARISCVLSTGEQAIHRRTQRFVPRTCRMGSDHRTGFLVRQLYLVLVAEPTLARFLRHSLQALAVTTPSPRRLLELELVDPSIFGSGTRWQTVGPGFMLLNEHLISTLKRV